MLKIVNIAIQIGAIYVYQISGVIWPLYLVMGLMGLLVFIQVISASGIFSGLVPDIKLNNKDDYRMGILVGITYLASCYQLYIMGFVFFAGMVSTHAAIVIITNLLRGINS